MGLPINNRRQGRMYEMLLCGSMVQRMIIKEHCQIYISAQFVLVCQNYLHILLETCWIPKLLSNPKTCTFSNSFSAWSICKTWELDRGNLTSYWDRMCLSKIIDYLAKSRKWKAFSIVNYSYDSPANQQIFQLDSQMAPNSNLRRCLTIEHNLFSL